MIPYESQRNDNTCGFLSLLNSHIHFTGSNPFPSYSRYLDTAKTMYLGDVSGLLGATFDRKKALKYFGLVQEIPKCDYSGFKKWVDFKLSEGRVVFLWIAMKSKKNPPKGCIWLTQSHSVLIVGKKGPLYSVVNAPIHMRKLRSESVSHPTWRKLTGPLDGLLKEIMVEESFSIYPEVGV